MFTEDLDAFLSSDEHAVDGTYDGATAVKVIFDNDFLRALGMVDTTNPSALGRASVFPAAAVTKALVIAWVTYTIRSRQPFDDGAFVVLQLEVS